MKYAKRKNIVKNTNLHSNKPIKKPIKSLSETELSNIKLFINNKKNKRN